MGSVAEQNRKRRARTVARAYQVANDRLAPPPDPPEPRHGRKNPYRRKITGLVWLHGLEAIDSDQLEAGERFGRDYRFSIIESGAALKSSLNFEDLAAGGGGGGGGGTAANYAGLIVDAREAIAEARAALGYHPGMVAACELICGRGLTPREICPEQRDAAAVVTGLQVALDLLVRHYRARQSGR